MSREYATVTLRHVQEARGMTYAEQIPDLKTP